MLKKKQKKNKKRTGFWGPVRNLFESNKNDLHIKLASHQVPVSFQTRTSLLLSFFWIICILYTRACLFHWRLLPGLSWYLYFYFLIVPFSFFFKVKNGPMPKPIVFPLQCAIHRHIVQYILDSIFVMLSEFGRTKDKTKKDKKKFYILSMKRIRKLMPVRVSRLIDTEILLDGFITF